MIFSSTAKQFSSQLNQLLTQYAKELNSGDVAHLINKLQTLSDTYPENADVLHLKGLVHKKLGDLGTAKACLHESLKLAPMQPQVLNSLANLYKSLNSFVEAEEHYQQALKALPNYKDAWKNLGLLLHDLDRLQDALHAFQQAINLDPENVSFLTCKANVLKDLEQYAQARDVYLQALEINPVAVNALHNLGLLHKVNDNLDEALSYYHKAKQKLPNDPDVNFSIANALYEKKSYAEAEEAYLHVLKLQGDHVLAHEMLNEYYWQMGETDKFGLSYATALSKDPDNVNLLHAYIQSMMFAKDQTQLARIIDVYSEQTRHPKIMHLLGKIYANQKQFDLAFNCFQGSLDLVYSKQVSQDLIQLHIAREEYVRADSLLSLELQKDKHDQLSWALQSLSWRLQESDKYLWLNRNAEYIKSYTLEVPNGYRDLHEYLEQLGKLLDSMHISNHEPLKQTLKNGSQTVGRLLYKDNHLLQLLKQGLADRVSEYIASLEYQAEHPLLSRISKDFIFSGSWSVKLKSDGFHVNHVHPAGWISSAFYVSIPEITNSASVANAGAIKFGESSLALGDREKIQKIIQPSPGQLVLFPSYTWHGTIPFVSKAQQTRLTAPFDVIPGVGIEA